MKNLDKHMHPDASGERRESTSYLLSVGLVMGGLFLALFLAVHSGPISMSVERTIATDNVILVLACAAVGTVALVMAMSRSDWHKRTSQPLEIFLFGIAAMNYGWVTHRAYWALWRALRDRGYYEIAESMTGAASLFTAASFVMITLGAILVLNIPLRMIFGRHWFLKGSICFVGLWGVVYQVFDLLPQRDL